MTTAPEKPETERVFLDANVMFSAAIGSASCRLVQALPGLALLTSDYCVDEARRNLIAKATPDATAWLDTALTTIDIVSTPPPSTWHRVVRDLPTRAVSDRPVLAAAVAVNADTLITGNTGDFSHLMRNPVAALPVVLTPRDFLRRGPRQG